MLLAKIRREFGVKFTLRRILYIKVLKFINLTKKKKKCTNYIPIIGEWTVNFLSQKKVSPSPNPHSCISVNVASFDRRILAGRKGRMRSSLLTQQVKDLALSLLWLRLLL